MIDPKISHSVSIQDALEAELSKTFAPCYRLLSLYSCPSDCEAFCCKNCEIIFGTTEYKKIYDEYPDKREFLASNTITDFANSHCIPLKYYEFSTVPCPFLAEDRCSIQAAKPTTCKLYPLTVGKEITGENPFEGKSAELVSLDPCPMGIEIMVDYVVFKSLYLMKYGDGTRAEKEKIILEDVELLNGALEQAKTFRVAKKIKSLYIPIEIFDPLYTFVKKINPVDRMHDIKEIGINYPVQYQQ